MAIDNVLDYAAMKMPYTPRRLHREDCIHPGYSARYRKATPQELRTLRECSSCVARERKERGS